MEKIAFAWAKVEAVRDLWYPIASLGALMVRFIGIGLIFISGWSGYAATAPATVFTAKASPQAIFNILSFPARVESRVNASIKAESDGFVSEIVKPLGSRVRRGDTIAIIKHTDPVYEYAPLNVRASVAGVVNEVNVTPGSLVNKGDTIASVTDPNQIRVIIEVAALDVRSMSRGLTGDLTISGMAQTITTHIHGISPSVDPALGTATCELTISAADQKLVVPGMVGRVQFKVNQRAGFMLPDSAIVYRGDSTFVRLLENGHSKRVAVKLGEKRQGQVEVLTGIKNGDEIINRASRFVGEGEAVQVETAHD